MSRRMVLVALLAIILVGCAQPTPLAEPTPAPSLYPTYTRAPATATSTAVPTGEPTAKPSVQPTAEPTAEPTAVAATTVDISAQHFIDDRSSAVRVLASLFNAINRKEYLRAYSYWDATGQIASTPYSDFEAGYADTESVELQVGQATTGSAAGNLYYTVPVLVSATTTDGQVKRYAGCYLLHLSQPAVQGVPPFQPMAIREGTLKRLDSGQDSAALLASACAAAGYESGSVVSAEPAYAPDDISAARYLDDRSDAVQVLRSYFNAINRKEYVRAYSYWKPEAAASLLPPFEQFVEGYAATAETQLVTGQVQSDAGAGQYYDTVPVALRVVTTSGAVQTFAGCYQLHISNPGIQATPPFVPRQIISATVTPADNNADLNSLAAQACQ